ncbi:MAG TPA: flavin reductase family protein [Gemmatimonadales bacterium]|nr:flavin reductase family protein [Gemmatimonadales bacterium]
MIDPYEFRRLCGRYATGVTIVTVLDAAGQPGGMTASSFTSVSLEPPLILVAVDHTATIYPVLSAVDRFTVNILSAEQEALSRRFANGLADRFDGVGWHANADGHVVLDGALAHLACDRWGTVPAGDHTIFIGQVSSGAAADHGRPLLHYRGGYTDESL